MAYRVAKIALQKSLLNHKFNGSLGMTKRYAADISMWKPGPRPRTKEEIEKAAIKYNMIPEDYDFYDEDLCVGDYPKITPVSAPARDPYADWDDEFTRQNYGEPLHFYSELTHGWMRAADDDLRFEKSWLFMFSWGVLCPLAGYALLLIGHNYNLTLQRPLMPKQYVGVHKVHYNLGTEQVFEELE